MWTIRFSSLSLWPMGDQTFVVFTFLANELSEKVNESLTLQLVPTSPTLQTMPIGEGVFFKQEISLTIMDADRKFKQL